jgi:hypothetical protein
MSEVTTIILRLLWRFYPIAWLTTAIVRGLSTITSWLEEEGYRSLLAQDPKECAWIGGWLSLAEDRLNELVAMKAMKLLKRRWRPRDPCGHHAARAVRTPEEIVRRLSRLIALYHDHKRLYELRARKLQRLLQQAELQLEVVHHPVEATTTIFQIRCSTTIFSAGVSTTIPIPTIFRAPRWSCTVTSCIDATTGPR